MLAPRHVERVNSSIRFPECIVTFTAEMIDVLVGGERPDVSGPGILLIVNTANGRGVAVGVFSSGATTRQWWDQPYNGFRRSTDTVAVLVPVVDAAVPAVDRPHGIDTGDARVEP